MGVCFVFSNPSTQITALLCPSGLVSAQRRTRKRSNGEEAKSRDFGLSPKFSLAHLERERKPDDLKTLPKWDAGQVPVQWRRRLWFLRDHHEFLGLEGEAEGEVQGSLERQKHFKTAIGLSKTECDRRSMRVICALT